MENYLKLILLCKQPVFVFNLRIYAQDLLNLMVVGEETLTHSLIQECEMRLLGCQPIKCFCWNCCGTSVRTSDSTICTYRVQGPSMLLTGNNGLDVLAFCQYYLEEQEPELSALSASSKGLRYQIKNYCDDGDLSSTIASPIQLLKNTAVQTILIQFAQVLKSQSFLDSVEWNTSRHKDINNNNKNNNNALLLSQQILLLQTCLEELTRSN